MEDVTPISVETVPSATVDVPDLGMPIAAADAVIDASGTAIPENIANMEVAVEEQAIASVADSEAMLVETQPQEAILAVPEVLPMPPNPELDKYNMEWHMVQENPSDFATWTALLSTAEKLGDLPHARVAFDAFLSEYPLCYGYWKKFADLELRNQLPQLALAVYERGVAATPYSPDLWAHYAMFKKAQPGVTLDDVRSIYERGVAYNGSDYSAHTLWDRYIAFEQESGDALHMAALLSRILGCPIRELDRFYHSFKTLVYRTPTGELIPADELASIRSELTAQAALKAETEAAAVAVEAAAAAAALAQATAAADTAALVAAAAAEAAAAAAAPESATQEQHPAVSVDSADAGAAPVKLEPADLSANAAKVEPTAPGDAMESSPAKASAPIEVPAVAADEMEVDASEAAPMPAATEASTPVALSTEPDTLPTLTPATAPPASDASSEQHEPTAVKTEAPADAASADTTPPPATESAAANDASATSTETSEAAAAAAAAAAIVVVSAVAPIPEEDIKARWSAPRDALYESAVVELRNRKGYEEGIKRPYFHVKPLDAAQLNNWIQYLDVTEHKGDKGAIVMLYERCLVACASYPEFWMRYIRYLEAAGDMEGADSALQRALQVHCKRRPATHLFAARCEELRGGIEQARTRYAYVITTLAPGLVSAVVAAANFERRQGKNDAAVAHLETLMNQCREKEGRLFPFMALTLAEFLRKHTGNVDRARKVIDDALEVRPTNKALWEGAIAFEEAVGGPASVARTLSLYDKATSPPAASRKDPSSSSSADAHAHANGGYGDLHNTELNERDREEMSARSVEFADSHADAATLALIEARHAGRFMLPATVAAEGRKRAAADAAVSGAAQAAKVARVEAEAAAAATAAAAAAAAAGGYYPTAAAGGYPPAPAYPYGYAGYAPSAYPASAYPTATASAYPTAAASAYPTGYGHPQQQQQQQQQQQHQQQQQPQQQQHQQQQQQQYPGYGY